MKGSSSGKLTGSGKLSQTGKWEMQVTYSGATGYLKNASPYKTFSVK